MPRRLVTYGEYAAPSGEETLVRARRCFLDAVRRKAYRRIVQLRRSALAAYEELVPRRTRLKWADLKSAEDDRARRLADLINDWFGAFNDWEWMADVALASLAAWAAAYPTTRDRPEFRRYWLRVASWLVDPTPETGIPIDATTEEEMTLHTRCINLAIERGLLKDVGGVKLGRLLKSAGRSERFTFPIWDPRQCTWDEWKVLLDIAAEIHRDAVRAEAEAEGLRPSPFMEELDKHCEWLVLNQVQRKSHGQIADAYFDPTPSRQSIGAAIKKVANLIGFPYVQPRAVGRPRGRRTRLFP